jgi:hypothetical protein
VEHDWSKDRQTDRLTDSNEAIVKTGGPQGEGGYIHRYETMNADRKMQHMERGLDRTN